MATIHSLARLPAELRLNLSSFKIPLRHTKSSKAKLVPNPASQLRLMSTTPGSPIPATVHVNRKATTSNLNEKSLFEPKFFEPTAPWHTWANSATGTLRLDVGEMPLSILKPVAARITHLKFERKISAGKYYWGTWGEDGIYRRSTHVDELRDFPDLKEVHIVNTDDERIWHGATPVQSILSVNDDEEEWEEC